MEEQQDYSKWRTEDMINRITSLEQQLKEQTTRGNSTSPSPKLPSPSRKPKIARVNRVIDPSRYSTRFIALKFAYLGQRYNGLEFHPNNKTPLPTIEEELWKALNKAKLVFPTPNPLLEPYEPNWEGCEYSKCGRTDKGVSAFGQVIGIRVRSNRPVQRIQTPNTVKEGSVDQKEGVFLRLNGDEALAPPASAANRINGADPSTASSDTAPLGENPASFNPINDEIPYCQILNRLLPPDIRVLAWCPNPPPDFSARFSCRQRQYKYFFTQPAFTPTIGSAGLLSRSNATPPNERRREGWLDISSMRTAAQKFVGLHDFRNFCKIDPSKQIENFERRITYADIEYVDPLKHPLGYISKPGFSQFTEPDPSPIQPHDPLSTPSPSTSAIYTITLHGSAFLWHQVRHMASILFLIGQGLEPPSLIDTLLDIRQTPRKPQYEMADDAPLVLWDCLFPHGNRPGKVEDALEWVHVGDYTGGEAGVDNAGGRKGAGKFGLGGLVDEMWRVWRGRKMDELLAGSLLDVVVAQGRSSREEGGSEDVPKAWENRSQRVFQGGDAAKLAGRYVPVMEKPRMETVETVNARYARRKGFEQREEVRERGFRKLGLGVDEGQGGSS